jgi:type IV secretory pathway protease TraF
MVKGLRTAWRIVAVVATLSAATIVIVGLMLLAPQTVRLEGSGMAPALRNDDRAPRPPQSFAGIQLATDEYFVLGDNRGDSREWGPVARRHIRKRLAFTWWRGQR